jgi:hypothetical protein
LKTDMYLPSTGQHYMAQKSQIAPLERSGWVVYADWLAAQNTAPAPAPAPEPAPAPADTTTDPAPEVDTVPAPTL